MPVIPFVAMGNHTAKLGIFYVIATFCSLEGRIFLNFFLLSRTDVLILCDGRYFCVFCHAVADTSCVNSFTISVIARLPRPGSISGEVKHCQVRMQSSQVQVQPSASVVKLIKCKASAVKCSKKSPVLSRASASAVNCRKVQVKSSQVHVQCSQVQVQCNQAQIQCSQLQVRSSQVQIQSSASQVQSRASSVKYECKSCGVVRCGAV